MVELFVLKYYIFFFFVNLGTTITTAKKVRA